MIFVTVGTSTQPFDRLVAGAAPLTETEKVVVQYGASAIRPAGATAPSDRAQVASPTVSTTMSTPVPVASLTVVTTSPMW